MKSTVQLIELYYDVLTKLFRIFCCCYFVYWRIGTVRFVCRKLGLFFFGTIQNRHAHIQQWSRKKSTQCSSILTVFSPLAIES